MAIATQPPSAITAGSREAPVFLAPTLVIKREPKISFSLLYPEQTFPSVAQISAHPLFSIPVEKLSDHERGRRGELRFAKLGMELFGDIVSAVRLSEWNGEDDQQKRDVVFILDSNHPLQEVYGQSKSDKLNADKDRAEIRDELKIVHDPQQVRRVIAERKLMIVNTAATRNDDDVKDSIWKDFTLIHEVYGLPLPARAIFAA